MAKTQVQTIKLGDRIFEVRRLKLGEMRAVESVINAVGASQSSIEFAARIFVAGLPDAKLSEADILEMTAPRYELDSGATKLLEMLGWNPPAPGEATPQPAG